MKQVVQVLKVLGLIILSLFCNILPMRFLMIQDKFGAGLKWLVVIAYVIFIGVVITLLWKAYEKKAPLKHVEQKMGKKDIGIAFLYFLAARVVAIAGTLIIQSLTGQETTANDAALQSLTSLFEGGFFGFTLIYCLLVGIFGPIIEEMAYRAFPTALIFKGKLGLLPGLVTTAVFALPHATTVLEFCLYFCIGFILYLAYQRRGNIKDSILVHILNNLPSAIVFLLMGL
jgi:hypothetical protein